MDDELIPVVFVGGRYAGRRRLTRTPELLVLTMGFEHHVYARRMDPDTLQFVNVYDYTTIRYGTEEAIG